MFQPTFKDRDIARFNPSGKNMIAGIILPMFNPELLEQPNVARDSHAFLTSQLPFRSAEIDPETGLPSLYQPCVEVKMHKFVGPRGETFVSAKSRETLYTAPGGDTSTADPLCDIYVKAKAQEKGHPWHYLTEDGSGKDGYTALSWCATQFVFCVEALDQKATNATPKVGALFLPKAGVIDYLRLMDIGRRGDTCPTPRDPDWPFYLYGDVRNPNRPLRFKTVMKANPSNVGQTFAGFVFSSNEVSLAGSEEGAVVPEATLARRPHVYDSGIYEIPTYVDFLQRITDEEWFDKELIKQACGDKGNIGGSPALGDPATYAAYAAPTPEATGQAPMYSAPATTAVAEPKVWVCMPGGQPREIEERTLQVEVASQPQLQVLRDGQWVVAAPPVAKYWVSLEGGTAEMTKEELQAKVSAGFVGQAMLQGGETVWKTVAELGFIMPAPPQPPAAPQPPAPPQAPAPPQGPAAPQPPAFTTAAQPQPPAPPAPTATPQAATTGTAFPSSAPAPAGMPAPPQGPAPSGSEPWSANASQDPIHQKVAQMSPAELSARRVELTSKLSTGDLSEEDAREISYICERTQ